MLCYKIMDSPDQSRLRSAPVTSLSNQYSVWIYNIRKNSIYQRLTQGIGFAIAQSLLKEGANAIINGRSEGRIAEAVQKLNQLSATAEVSGFAADFSKVDEVNALLARLPDVDILVNNAGIFEPKAFTDISDDEWFRFFEVNVLSGVRLAGYFFPTNDRKELGQDHFHIQRVRGQYSGRNDSLRHHKNRSIGSESRIGRSSPRASHVTVNTVMPGPTKSEGVADFVKQLGEANGISSERGGEGFLQKCSSEHRCYNAFASVKEIANLVAYVASPLSSGTNGSH